MRCLAISALFFISHLLPAAQDGVPQADCLTIAESSGFKATATHAQVMTLVKKLAERSSCMHLSVLGKTHEGRDIPLIILADPPVRTVEAARKSGKPVVLVLGNIHAGEVCGKEALLMLARSMTSRDSPDKALLKDLIIALAPIYNADGNERFSTENRPRQVGPAAGVGTRANAQGLDLNRDYIKLEAPESRALARFMRRWDPAVIIDTHTTNGSHHRYALTYAGPKHPAGNAGIIGFVRDAMLPAVTEDLRRQDGWDTFFYGNFRKDHSRWDTYPAYPRNGTPYRGLRNRIAILTEAYAYASYKDRVLATRDFVRACLRYAASHRDKIKALLAAADKEAIEAGRRLAADDAVAIRTQAMPLKENVIIKGVVEKVENGKRVATDKPRDYPVVLVNEFKPTLTVKRPHAYLIPAVYQGAINNLKRHGIAVDELREDITLAVEAYTVGAVTYAIRPYQKHHLVKVEVTPTRCERRVDAGTCVVKTDQPLGGLIVNLLEPAAEDGLTAWNFFDRALACGETFPVLRLPKRTSLMTCPAAPLSEDRPPQKRITYDALYQSRRPPRLSGNPVRGLSWAEDGVHYFQHCGGGRQKVHAETGRMTPCPAEDKTALMAKAIAALPGIDKKTAGGLARRAAHHRDSAGTAGLFLHDDDLYWCRSDGSRAMRLTSTPQRKALYGFSPDGAFVSFVCDNDLWVVDVKTRNVRQLTTGGHDRLRRGYADWVYFEEVFHRNWKTHWWSPDGLWLAFLELDDAPVDDFVIADNRAHVQQVETETFPKPGTPNPTVRLGMVRATGGPVIWADLSGYDASDFLITGVGFWPDGKSLYFYGQNRIQSWMDLCRVSLGRREVKRLFRETTGAWVKPPKTLHFLPDGDFLMTSERTGYRHLYLYDAAGKRKGPVTSGAWEMRRLLKLDHDAGWIYFTANRDSPTGDNAYRVRMDGKDLSRLTRAPGHHSIAISPNGKYFIDRWSSHSHPDKVALRGTDGLFIRWLDTNPVHHLADYRLGRTEMVQIKTKDSFWLEGMVITPPDLSANKKYPVWFSTYAGPHAQTVRDTWSGGRLWDQMMAQSGFVVFHADPRSASGKGAVSTWAAYRQLGVQELADIEAAIRWLAGRAYVDASRIGISGHSYGGFMTAFAMTHSKVFAAGIAGAPVTDWRDYDSIYTERYMATPQANPDGYRKTSVTEAAKDLHGRLLLLHGAMDDNVHLQHTLRLADALQRAGKPFELMIYPGARHGIGGGHYRRLRYDFMCRLLTSEK